MSRWNNDGAKFLIGKTIVGMMIRDDKEALLLQTAAGGLVIGMDADCCSHTWIESVSTPALGYPAKIIDARDLELNKPDSNDGDYDVVRYYGAIIVTDRGDIVLDYRNSSNGYYGGNIVWPDSYSFDGDIGEYDWQIVQDASYGGTD